MLDLQFLETLVEEALSNETESTLKEWLVSQREADLFNYFGNGYVESLTPRYNVKMTTIANMKFSEKKSETFNCFNTDKLATAA